MCGRYTTEIETDEKELFRLLARAEETVSSFAAGAGSVGQRANAALPREVFPSETAPVIIGDANGNPDAFFFRWGYPMEINAKKRLLINARSETAHEKAMFAESLLYYRCVVPTAGFFEWQHTNGKADARRKYRFNRTDTGILYLAGLYRTSVRSGEREFVILTREANVSMVPIHDRMPVILRAEHIAEYLGDAHAAVQLLSETPPLLFKKSVS